MTHQPGVYMPIRALFLVFFIKKTTLITFYMFIFFSGSGQFGSVCKGVCTLRSGQKVPVAIKTLKKENIDSAKEVTLALI